MTQNPQKVELSRPFRESAERLCRHQPKLGRQIQATLRQLFDQREGRGLHREPIRDSWSSNVWSCRVNLRVRLIEDETIPLVPRAMYVDNHDAAYRWARLYRGGGTDDDQEWLYRSDMLPNREESDAIGDESDCANHPSGLDQLRYLGPAALGEPDMTCIPAKELRNLGLSSSDANRIRRASPDARLEYYLPEDILDALANLYFNYSDLCDDGSVTAEARDTTLAHSDAPMPIPLAPEDDVVTITAPSQFLSMLELGLDRYLTTLTERQAELARVEQRGLLVVQGSGGSGKTTIAVHRLRYLADRITAQPALQANDDRRVLYLCFNRTLAAVVRQMLNTLYGGKTPRHIEIHTLHQWSREYLERRGVLAGIHNAKGHYIYRRVRSDMQGSLTHLLSKQRQEAKQSVRDSARLSARLIADEIEEVIIGRALTTTQEYLNTDREGRRSGLRQSERQYIWNLYREWRRELDQEEAVDVKLLSALALHHLLSDDEFMPYDAVVVDEAQDLTPVGLRLASHLAGLQHARITIFADAAQSIYRSGFRWKQAELNPRGRQLQRLAQNHRNTAQIWEMATSFLEAGSGPDEPDAYVTAERPTSTGDLPLLLTCPNIETQVAEVVARIRRQLDAGVPLQNIGILAGVRKQIDMLVQALRDAHISTQTDESNERIDITHPSVKALTMHSAKGLDFPHVYLVGLTEGGIPGTPPETTIDAPEDDHLELQRRLLYTAMIRAGRSLVMTTVAGQEHVLVADIRDAVCVHERVGIIPAELAQ